MRAGMLVATLAISIAAAASPAFAADATERLQRDLVQVKDGKFVYDDLSICHLNLPSGPSNKFQIRSRASAPAAGVISRDRFVALVTATEVVLSLGMAEGASGAQTASRALGALDCDPLDAPIGAVDIELTTTMTAEGMQVEVTSTATNKVTRSTRTWQEIYE